MEEAGKISILLVSFLIVLAIVVGNILTIIAVLRKPKMGTVSNQFVLGLAIADLLVAFALPYNLIVIFFVSPKMKFTYPEFVGSCVAPLMPLIVSSIASNLNLLLIGMDRLYAVSNPLSHRAFMSRRKARLAVCCSFLIATFMSSLLFILNDWKEDEESPCIKTNMSFVYYSCVLLPTFVMTIILLFIAYGKILHVAATVSTNAKKSLKMVSLIISCYCICWLPFMIRLFIEQYDKDNHNFQSNTALYYAQIGTFLLMCSNSFMNPIIYTMKSGDFRKAYREIILCKKEVVAQDGSKQATSNDA
ncbi:D(2) dopamine receptor-like [Neocloeon triangulifer]|uniref:D(2) dopamine receptor-like n=1 Tax=Neocloeon triangulifer TaxID=2078957 RepID=UPI00286F7067|nr:D(2) dopamine receptor-like [Neocloeon triangulifer]